MEEETKTFHLSSLNPQFHSNNTNGAFSYEPNDNTKSINISGSKPCAEGCGRQGKWRYVTRNFLCLQCRHTPPHKLITRTKAKAMFNLSFDDLHDAMLNKQIHMFTVKNFHSATAPPIRLYYLHEVENLARRLGRRF